MNTLIIDELCEYCDMDPAECYNIGYCPYEKDCEEETVDE